MPVRGVSAKPFTGHSHFRGARIPDRFEHAQHGRARALGAPFGYYDDGNSGYDLPIVTPEEQPVNHTAMQPANPTAVQPANPTAVYPYAAPPRSGCTTQTYKVLKAAARHLSTWCATETRCRSALAEVYR
jgi:hypothetical protein